MGTGDAPAERYGAMKYVPSGDSDEDGEIDLDFPGGVPPVRSPTGAAAYFSARAPRAGCRGCARYAAALAAAVILGFAARAATGGAGPAALAAVGAPGSAAEDSGGGGGGGGGSRVAPHILHVVLDDVGTNDLWESRDLTPGVVSPTISALAAEGVSLSGYYGQSYCTVARMALLTGKFPHRLGFAHGETPTWGPLEIVGDANYSLPLGHALVPEHLGRAGYATHGVGKWNVGHCAVEYAPWNRGFDTFLGYFSDGMDYTTHAVDEYGGGVISTDSVEGVNLTASHVVADLVRYDGAGDEDFRWDRGLEYVGSHTTTIFTDEALARLMEKGDNRPKYVWLAYHGAHDNTGSARNLTVDETSLRPLENALNTARFQFARNVKAMDDGIAKLKRALVASGRDFLIALHSDNGGWPCGAHLCGSNAPRRGAKFDFMEGALKVPALLYSPTLLPARSDFAPLFHHVDWLATFLSAATGASFADVAATLGPGYDSRSQYDAVRTGAARGPRDTIYFSLSSDGLVIRKNDFKLVHQYTNATWYDQEFDPSNFTMQTARDACFAGNAPTSFLFDVAADPEERTNLFLDHSYHDVVDALIGEGREAYAAQRFDFPLDRAWIFKDGGSPEAARLRATWVDTSDDADYRFIAPWGCSLVHANGAVAKGTPGIDRGEDGSILHRAV